MSSLLKGIKSVFVEVPADEGGAPVKADHDMLDRILAETDNQFAQLNSGGVGVGASPLAAPPAAGTPALTGTSFSPKDIYLRAGVPDCPYPAEKLLKFLENVRGLDDVTRKATVAAMANADDDWNLQDPVKDAQAKIEALQQAKTSLTQQFEGVRQKVALEIADNHEYLSKATELLKAQISELQVQLKAEEEDVQNKNAKIQQDLANKEAETKQELRNLDNEVARLSELPRTFGTTAA